MTKYWLGLAACMVVASPASAKDKAPPPAPQEQPDWSKVREQTDNQLKAALFDPTSAQITYTSGFQWGYTKPIIGGRKWGWVACGNINAKNRMGGYVGAQAFVVRSDEGGNVTIIDDSEDIGTCTKGEKVALQPELRDIATNEASANGRLGVAEELIKLADLRDKGIITAEEFEAQKAKLLAR